MRLESVRIVPKVAFLLLVATCPAWAPAADVSMWSIHEITLTASGNNANWYIAPDAELTATFTGPGGVKKVVPGFWDGGNTFKIRFTPTAQGTWTYTTASPNVGLNKKTGTIHATAPKPGNHGFLRIDPNYKTSFVWDDGTRYFMEGQTYYDWIQAAMVNDNWKTSTDKLPAYGFNKVRMQVYCTVEGEEHGSGIYPDVAPYTGSADSPDRDSLNLPYWRKLDEMVRYLDSKGIVADLIVTNPYRKNVQFGTAAQNDRFVRYVAARYAAYTNVIWCLGQEWEKAYQYNDGRLNKQFKSDHDRMGILLHKSDPWMAEGAALRPLTIHNMNINFQFFDQTWPTHAVIQHPGTDTHGNLDAICSEAILVNLGHNMPVVDDEYGYVQTLTRDESRWGMWAMAAAGGYSSTADGSNIPGLGVSPEIFGDWQDSVYYDDIKRMVDFFTTKGIEYWKMTSHNDLVTSGQRTYVLAEPGRQYVVYAAAGGTFSVNLAAGSYKAFRYNPRTGATEKLSPVSGGGSRSFTMPDANDWVISLTSAP